MTCREIEAYLHPYVDGELSAGETAAADAHVGECAACAKLVQRERRFRDLLRRQPREAAPPELRGVIRAAVHARARTRALRPWLLASGAVAAAIVVIVLLLTRQAGERLVAELIDTHIAYEQFDRPVELASTDGAEIERWFRRRAGLPVLVADFSRAGIHLIGARLARPGDLRVAYVLYEKGHTLLSAFLVPEAEGRERLAGRRVSYRGRAYVVAERKGHRLAGWTEGPVILGLVSMLDEEALLECAAHLRATRDATRGR
jgi:anti-sigma factor RsiW